jgi:hypothetical protein
MPGTVSEVSATLVASTTRRPWMRGEHARLLLGRLAREQRQHFSAGGWCLRSASAASRISRSPGRNTSTSPGPLRCASSTASTMASLRSVRARLSFFSSWVRPGSGSVSIGCRRPDTSITGAGFAAMPKCRLKRSASSVAEVTISFSPAASAAADLQVAEQEVDVEAALVGLVDEDRVVLAQQRIGLGLGQQDAVGHQLDVAGRRDLVGEADLEADMCCRARLQFLRDAASPWRARRSAAAGCGRSGRHPTAEFEADLGQLGGLARAGFATDDHHLVLSDGLGDLGAALIDRQSAMRRRRGSGSSARLRGRFGRRRRSRRKAGRSADRHCSRRE